MAVAVASEWASSQTENITIRITMIIRITMLYNVLMTIGIGNL